MKWAVYIDDPEKELECVFFPSEEEAKDYIDTKIAECEQASADAEKNLFWDITLLRNVGEVGWGPNGLQLVKKS